MLSIITPTYNRSQTLTAVYESLKKQTNKQFEWIIIDDGSTDNTEIVADAFTVDQNNGFFILYHKKTNGGKHTALNEAYKYIQGEIVLILDSDDYLTNDAVETIINDWDNYKSNLNLCGLSYLKSNTSGKLVGDKFPDDIYIASYVECRINKNIKGDKAEVFRTNLLLENPFPVFEGENFMGESVIWTKLGFLYETVHINKVIYICEYLEGGLTQSGRALRIKCPKGGMLYCKVHIDKRIKFKVRLRMIMLYLVYAYYARKPYIEAVNEVKKYGYLFFLCSFPAYLLYLYWKAIYK